MCTGWPMTVWRVSRIRRMPTPFSKVSASAWRSSIWSWRRRKRGILNAGDMHGRTASAGHEAGAGSSALRCDNGQRRELSALHASDAPYAVQMAESSQPTQVVYMGRLLASPSACRLAPGASASQPEPFCVAERLNEEPDMGKPFVRFCEGLRHNWSMAEIRWHRRETRRQTENTNFTPTAPEDLSLLDKNSNASFSQRLRSHRCLLLILQSAVLSPILTPTKRPRTPLVV
jgi:hypothetical protein